MRVGRFGSTLNRRLERSALLLSVLAAVLGGLVVGALTWWGLWRLLGARAETPNQLDLTKIALWVTAGVGGAVALVVAYRRQRDTERGRFAELFGAAARQLGDPDVAVRVAGVYAMAGVADEFSVRSRRQQCVDVLCGYLRLPYLPEEGASHLSSKSQRVEDSGTAVERIYHYRQNDRQVRDTIVRVIGARLRPSAEISWSDCDFDFSDVLFEDADFHEAVFTGRVTRFAGAQFIGVRGTSFERTRFLGDRTSFQGAVFRNATTFEAAHFAGARTEFVRTNFNGVRTTFANAKLTADLTSFESALFDGERITFTGAEFLGIRITFTGARFYAGSSSFDCAHLGAPARWRSGRTLEANFSRADYHGKVSFADVVFSGRSVSFTGSDFFGDISFRRVSFDARTISFERPRAWVGIQFDWDASPSTKPANIEPTAWPPAPAETAPELTG